MEGITYKMGVIFEGFVGVMVIAATIVLATVLRSRYSRWGASGEELDLAIADDGLASSPKSQLTLARTVEAPVAAVWPWFGQLGCQHEGWHSYDLPDYGDVPNAERIIPKLQHHEHRRMVKATSKWEFGLPVTIVEEKKQLIMAGTITTETGENVAPNESASAKYFSGNQSFLYRSIDNNNNRLIFRRRIDWNPSLSGQMIHNWIPEPHPIVMVRKTKINVDRRAKTMRHRRGSLDLISGTQPEKRHYICKTFGYFAFVTVFYLIMKGSSQNDIRIV